MNGTSSIVETASLSFERSEESSLNAGSGFFTLHNFLLE
jgi:hypothetical protein